MAAALVGGALLSVSIQVFIDRMASQDVLEFFQRKKLNDLLLKKLKLKLLSANALLKDAEEKQIRNPDVREWIAELEEAIYDGDDLMDDINTEALQCKSPVFMERDKWLLTDDATCNKVSVIPIVGMGGIGKTTLAQLIYNDDKVKKYFEIKAWVCVSYEFDILTITQTILELVTSQTCHSKDLNQLQVKLKDILTGKKFLFVLDDIWNDNYIYWDTLKTSFESGAYGSKIIVTTRSERTANIMQTVPNHNPQIIMEEDCWSLFTKHAFDSAGSGVHLDLEVIGGQIVRKCKGLPLAVKSLGGVLRYELDPQEWNNVLKSDIWELSVKESDILPAPWLSYHLPSHLKRCFAYCSIFPKGYQFEKGHLILLWMAENLLERHKRKRAEEVGDEYFNTLLSKSLCQRHGNGGFTMHGLVNDLAKFVSGDFVLRFDDSYSHAVARKTRHLSYMKRNIPHMKNFDSIFENKHLHTILPLGYSLWNYRPNLFFRLLETMKYFRVLSLCEYSITKLPNSFCNLKHLSLTHLPEAIGKLKHLRHLDLSHTKIEKLPDSLCNLHDLYTLALSFCTMLTRLPTNLACLFNLRHLHIECTPLKEMPPQMSKMIYLQTLSDFVVSEHGGCNIAELKEFQNLRGSLCISRLQNVVDVEDGSMANLKEKKYLDRLSLSWDGDADDSKKEREVLDRLRPHTNLEKLVIRNYGGTEFPNWVGHHSFCGMVEVELSNCRNCYLLPPLGQLTSLKKLDIGGFDMVESTGKEFYYDGGSSFVTKPFKSLKYLSFSRMSMWKEWSVIGGDEEVVFSHLKKLYLCKCPMLNGARLPYHFPSLTSLHILDCDQLVNSLPRFQSPVFHLLTISNCPGLRSFPREGLPSILHTIEIHGCQKLESFREEGWPANLKSLVFSDCESLFTCSVQWNLQALTSLTSLKIISINEMLDSFPKVGQLPATLTHLELNDLQNLISLNGKAFQFLVSLKELRISFCSQLQCIPKEGLPTSLYCLDIYECGLLNQRCQSDIGEDWPKIAHIPVIQIH
ncbi:hypothetical protein FNV43_RR20125 [Rhamnella rubrinervis]|uniref:Disease resistance RPP13-like protein 1 n=1 Tax=Rhamnella rubrinervis TaxID=2594499 RepID=A0A8K0DTV0_9ROSA|nr:hypothetical protein FNV43_RR20125 [Rhamnella rubrinervis]